MYHLFKQLSLGITTLSYIVPKGTFVLSISHIIFKVKLPSLSVMIHSFTQSGLRYEVKVSLYSRMFNRPYFSSVGNVHINISDGKVHLSGVCSLFVCLCNWREMSVSQVEQSYHLRQVNTVQAHITTIKGRGSIQNCAIQCA